MWWSERILRLLEGAELGREISRGRAYAEEGRVLSVSVTPGRISATVSGTRPQPYRVQLGVRPIPDVAWNALVSEIQQRPGARAALLRGSLPGEAARLIPTDPVDLTVQCTCPVHDAICKHSAAVLFDFATRLVDEPHLLITWRGRDPEVLRYQPPHIRSA